MHRSMVPSRKVELVPYAELHCHSWFSFNEGASSIDELVSRAHELQYEAIALTDHDNLSGAMQFAQITKSLNMRGIIGAELTVEKTAHLTVLVKTPEGYANLCRLLSFAHTFGRERKKPTIPFDVLGDHTKGLIGLSGCPRGEIPKLISAGKHYEAEKAAKQYMECFGSSNFFVELQQNLVKGDTSRNKALISLAKTLKIGTVATNNVHYHIRERHKLQDCLVAIGEQKSLEETHSHRRPNSEFHFKTVAEMNRLFRDHIEAIKNTTLIAEQCTFDLLESLRYKLPEYPVPSGHTQLSFLRELCEKAAERRYKVITPKIRARLEKEILLVGKNNLAGFLLHYYEIGQLAREIMIRLGISNNEIPIEEQPPGRSRGSSVALLIGYLIGLSHIDPLKYGLSLERFLPQDLNGKSIDIDLDFPRNIREELILAIHKRWGENHAVLVGVKSRYKRKSAQKAIAKVLGISAHLQNRPSSMSEGITKEIRQSKTRMSSLVEQLELTPRYLGQHPGGMIISSVPVTELMPVERAVKKGRYICQWDKDDIEDAGFLKIDLLALGALSQLQNILEMVRQKTGSFIDISRIDFDDQRVYRMLEEGDTIGIFQIESPAQRQTITRIKPQNLAEMALAVGAVRPGVGVNEGVTKLIRRRMGKEKVSYDHVLEKRALERTLGIILFQDQVNQVAVSVAGFSEFQADQLRRAFVRKNNHALIKIYWEQFRKGAQKNGIETETAKKIFRKFNGQYMFPESHAVAFGVTAFQMAWLKMYYPIEFYVALFNEQPMGYYGIETLKEDAKRHQVEVLHPDINRSGVKCTEEMGALRLGLTFVSSITNVVAEKIMKAREQKDFVSLFKFLQKVPLKRDQVEKLVYAGAFDNINRDRRSLLWEIGICFSGLYDGIFVPQITLQTPNLKRMTSREEMEKEYRILKTYPNGHIMKHLRHYIPKEVKNTDQAKQLYHSQYVTVAGMVIRRQQPLSRAIFLTLEDEFGHISLIVWPKTYKSLKNILESPLITVGGRVSRREETFNVIVDTAERIQEYTIKFFSRDWA